MSQSVVDSSAIEQVVSPADAENVYGLTYFDKTSEGYRTFLEDMAQYQPDVVPGDLSAISWLSVQMFADVASELDEVTRQEMWNAMNALSNYDTGGMTEPLDFTIEGEALGGAAPRLVPSVLTVYADVYREGEWVPLDEDSQEPIPVFS